VSDFKKTVMVNIVIVVAGAIILLVAANQLLTLDFLGIATVVIIGCVFVLSGMLGMMRVATDFLEGKITKSKRRVCPICGSMLVRIIQDGNGFWYCRECSNKVGVPTTLRRRERLIERRMGRREF